MVGRGVVTWSRRRRAEAGYGFVLSVIVATYVVTVVASSSLGAAAVLVLQMVGLHAVLTTVGSRRGLVLAVDVGLAATLVALVGVAFARGSISDTGVETLIFWLSAVLYGVAPLSIAYRTLGRRTVDLQTLLAAISIYLMIGMFFAFLYRALSASQPTPFYGSAGDGSASDDLFFSFITLTTTGYGNIVPGGTRGRRSP